MKGDIQEFFRLLDACRMNKTELAAILGLHRGRVYQWKEAVPQYVMAYLRLHKKVLDREHDIATLNEALKILRRNTE